MDNKLARKILLGISAVIGMVVAGSIYKSGTMSMEDEPILLTDGDVEEINED